MCVKRFYGLIFIFFCLCLQCYSQDVSQLRHQELMTWSKLELLLREDELERRLEENYLNGLLRTLEELRNLSTAEQIDKKQLELRLKNTEQDISGYLIESNKLRMEIKFRNNIILVFAIIGIAGLIINILYTIQWAMKPYRTLKELLKIWL